MAIFFVAILFRRRPSGRRCALRLRARGAFRVRACAAKGARHRAAGYAERLAAKLARLDCIVCCAPTVETRHFEASSPESAALRATLEDDDWILSRSRRDAARGGAGGGAGPLDSAVLRARRGPRAPRRTKLRGRDRAGGRVAHGPGACTRGPRAPRKARRDDRMCSRADRAAAALGTARRPELYRGAARGGLPREARCRLRNGLVPRRRAVGELRSGGVDVLAMSSTAGGRRAPRRYDGHAGDHGRQPRRRPCPTTADGVTGLPYSRRDEPRHQSRRRRHRRIGAAATTKTRTNGRPRRAISRPLARDPHAANRAQPSQSAPAALTLARGDAGGRRMLGQYFCRRSACDGAARDDHWKRASALARDARAAPARPGGPWRRRSPRGVGGGAPPAVTAPPRAGLDPVGWPRTPAPSDATASGQPLHPTVEASRRRRRRRRRRRDAHASGPAATRRPRGRRGTPGGRRRARAPRRVARTRSSRRRPRRRAVTGPSAARPPARGEARRLRRRALRRRGGELRGPRGDSPRA